MASVPRRRRRLLLGTLVALLLTPVASASAGGYPPLDAPVPARADSALTCTPVITYASRGSSENANTGSYYEGLGQEMVPIWYALRDLYGTAETAQSQIQLITNRTAPVAEPQWMQVGYPAIGIAYIFPNPPESIVANYESSVAEGVESAIADLKAIRQQCPSSNLVIIGYSEGAEVTRRALADADLNAFWDHTPEPGSGAAAGKVFTMLFGDVLWKSGEANVTYVGDTDRTQRGIIRRIGEGAFGRPTAALVPAIPGFGARWNVNSWCHGGDLACQAPVGTTHAHTTYGELDNVGAPMRAAAFAGGTFTRPVVTAKLSTPSSCFTGRPKETISVVGPAGSTAQVSGSWEPTSLGKAFARTTLSVGGQATATVPLQYTYLPTSFRFRANYLGKKLDYRNHC